MESHERVISYFKFPAVLMKSEVDFYASKEADQKRFVKTKINMLNSNINSLMSSLSASKIQQCAAAKERLQNLREEELMLQEKIQTTGYSIVEKSSKLKYLKSKINEFKEKKSDAQEELNKLIEKHTILLHEIKDSEDNLIKEYQARRQSIAFYKRFLRISIQYEQPDTFVVSFIDSSSEHSIKLSYSEEVNYWKILEVRPAIPNVDRIVERFNDSQNTIGFLCFMRNIFNCKR